MNESQAEHLLTTNLDPHRQGVNGLVLFDLPPGVTADLVQEAYNVMTADGAPWDSGQAVCYYWVVSPEQRERLYPDGRESEHSTPVTQAVLAWCMEHRKVVVPEDVFAGIVDSTLAEEARKVEARATLVVTLFGVQDDFGLLGGAALALEKAGMLHPGTARLLVNCGRRKPEAFAGIVSGLFGALGQNGEDIASGRIRVTALRLAVESEPRPTEDLLSALLGLRALDLDEFFGSLSHNRRRSR